MRYWVFVFVLTLVSFGLSGIFYIREELGEVIQGTGRAEDVTLLFVGDIMLARGVQTQMRKRNDFLYPFRRIARTLRGADFVFGNLEGPISSRGANQGSEYSFRADLRAVEGLKFAGFDVISLANNHIWDWGTPALLDTIDILKGAGIRAVGAGADLNVANAPAIVDVSGTRLGVLAYTNLYPSGLVAGENFPGVSDFQLERITEDIRAVRSRVDLVIVSYHWGEEYVLEPSEERRLLARAIIDAGADLIIGHHPHVVQKLEKYKKGWIPLEAGRPEAAEPSAKGGGRPLTGWIAYSLGNFVFDQNFSEETMKGEMLRVILRDRKISRVEKVPIQISETFQPYMVQ